MQGYMHLQVMLPRKTYEILVNDDKTKEVSQLLPILKSKS